MPLGARATEVLDKPNLFSGAAFIAHRPGPPRSHLKSTAGESISHHPRRRSAGGFVTILAEVGEQTSCGGPHHPLFSLPLALGIHIDEKLHLAG